MRLDDLRRQALDDPVVKLYLTAYDAGDCSLGEALIGLALYLSRQNRKLLSMLDAAEDRRPRVYQFPATPLMSLGSGQEKTPAESGQDSAGASE